MKRGKTEPRSLKWLRHDVTQSALTVCQDLVGLPTDPAAIVSIPMPDPEAFSTAESFRNAYWRAEMWSKFPFDIKGLDREKAAYAAFFEAERVCTISNERLCDAMSRPIPERYRSWLRTARSLMEFLLADFSVNEIIDGAKWGPGATTSLRRAQASPANKWELATHITAGALPYLLAFTRWSQREFPPVTIVPGNKVTTVPKNAKTDRVIAIEPDWNMFFQLGVGRALRSRLQRRFGLLKPIAQQVNQSLARCGSRSGDLATIDLKGASDSISLALVELLVPSSVLQHLLALRSPTGTVDGKVVTYEKISSMGNGFTFELETAIFYCLVRASSGHAVAYGDDLVCHASSYQQVVDFLTFCGFEVNLKKSYHAGPFRESCGGHFFRGVNVTPPYIRKPLIGPYRIDVANIVRARSDNGHWCDSTFMPLWDSLRKGIPRIFYGPRDVSGVIHSGPFECTPSYSRSLQCFTGVRIVETSRVREARPVGALLQSLWSISPEPEWRYSWLEKSPGPNVVRVGKWWSHWPGFSAWACHV